MLLEILEKIVIPVATVLLAVVAGYFAADRRADRDFRLRKLEQLWVYVDLHCNAFTGVMMDTAKLMNKANT